MHTNGKSVGIDEYMIDRKTDYLISFVIPAYNEEKRLPTMLEKTLDVIAAASPKYLQFI